LNFEELKVVIEDPKNAQAAWELIHWALRKNLAGSWEEGNVGVPQLPGISRKDCYHRADIAWIFQKNGDWKWEIYLYQRAEWSQGNASSQEEAKIICDEKLRNFGYILQP